MENDRKSNETVEDLFFKFMDAQDCPEITSAFGQLVKRLGIKSENPREFYSLLKGKLQTWRCKSLWELLDCRANQKEYGKGKICEDTQVLIIGAGPIGLRTAVEVALLGARVVIVEKRESFVRNNVLHLWPFLLTDFRSLGAKKFYGKFCSGSIDHISIRRLQSVLLKTALIFGAKLYTGVTFDGVIEPNSVEDGWRCKVSPASHPVSEYEFDVLIGADGKKNVIPGFQQIEMRGTLAIGITANFVNHCTEDEANVEEISGIAYQFNPQFFDELFKQKGIKLENIVYYKDETHYFVMTAGKASLLKRGALKEDFGPSAKLLSPSNIDHSKLLEYVTDVVKYATKGTLRNLELKIVGNNQPDIAAFDFTSIKKAEHAARIIERKGSKLLVGLVGDSLLEPFWPTGSGCARGVLSALDAAWMIRSFAQDKPPLQILSERENIYRLLSGTSSENLHKDHAKYTINPATRYLHITQKRIREVYHLFDTDDPVNADFSVGSPQITVSNKASRRRRISTGAKYTSSKGRARGRAGSHLDIAATRMRSTSGSSVENLVSHNPLSSTQSAPLDSRVRASTFDSDDEVFKTKTKRVRIKDSARRSRSSTVGSSGDELKATRKKSARKRSMTKDNPENPKENTRRKRGFFGFGRSKTRRKSAGESDYHSDKENKLQKMKQGEEQEKMEDTSVNGVALKSIPRKEEEKAGFARDDSLKRRPAGSFSRQQYTRRSTKDIIREMEARSKGDTAPNVNIKNEKLASKGSDSKRQELHLNGEPRGEGGRNRMNKNDNREVEEKAKIKREDEKKKQKEEEKRKKEEQRKKKDEEKRKHEDDKKRKEEDERKRKKKEDEAKKREQEKNLHNKKQQTTPQNKKSIKKSLLDEIAALSPVAKRAMPVLSKLSPENDKENEKAHEHSVTSVVRDAAMLVMATPLLIDGIIPKIGTDRKGSWLGRSSGRVRDVVNRYNTLNDMKPTLDKMNGNATPLKRPRDSVDGSERKPRMINVDNEEEKGNQKVEDAFDVKPTPPSDKKKTLQMKKDEKLLISSPSLERLKLKLQDEPSADDRTCSTSLPNGHVTKDFNSPIWQKTVIAQVAEHQDKRKENENEHTTKIKGEAKEMQPVRTKLSKQKRRSSVLPSEAMEEKLVNLLNSTTAERARRSIKYMISLFRQIQKNPTDERYYRIFKGRARFRKHVWSLRNAKLFMTSSGWTEIGSFIVFPLSKQTEGPMILLNKYLSITEEKIKEESSVPPKRDAPNLRRANSSDLAERILELKEALSSPRNNLSTKTKSGGTNDSRGLRVLQRTVSLDEVNIRLRAKTGVSGTSLKEYSTSRKRELSQKLRSHLDQGNVNKPNKLRRSVSENSLLESSEPCDNFEIISSRVIDRDEQSQKQQVHSDQVDENKPSNLRRSVSENTLLEAGATCDNLGPTSSRFTDSDNSSQKLHKHTEKEDENKPGNLRRSVSENMLLELPETSHSDRGDEKKPGNLRRCVSEDTCLESTETSDNCGPIFSPFTRRFSQRRVEEQEVSCDLLMENPIHSEISTVGITSDEEDFPTSSAVNSHSERLEVRSPQEAVLAEADQLSSVLGNLIDTLGSSTDNEREAGSEKETTDKPKKNKTSRKAKDEHKDEELETLCETLDMLINDTSSDSSSESQKKAYKERKTRNQEERRKTAFKPPLPPTQRTKKQQGKSKSVETVQSGSKRRSTTDGLVRHGRVSQAKSVDIAASTSNTRRKDRTSGSADSKVTKTKTQQRQGSSTRTYITRQNETSNPNTSRATNRKENLSSKRNSDAISSQRISKRLATKSKSVDLERSRTRPPVAKTKSVDHRRNGVKRNRSGRSASGRDGDKALRQSITEQSPLKSRIQTKRENPRESLAEHSKGKTEEENNKESPELLHENTITKDASSQEDGSTVHVPIDNNSVNDAESLALLGKTLDSCIAKDQDVTDVGRNGENEPEKEIAEDHPCCESVVRKNHVSDETESSQGNSDEIIKVSNSVQTYSHENEVFLNNDVQGENVDAKNLGNCQKEKQMTASNGELRKLVNSGKEQSTANGSLKDMDTHTQKKEDRNPSITQNGNTEFIVPQSENRKMTLLDLGKQQSRERSTRKEAMSLSLEERKQLMRDASVTKPKSKPADKRRSILQIKSRNDGNLVKNKKQAFEKPKEAHSASDGSDVKTSKQRHFRLPGRRRKSFELPSEPLEVLAEDQEEVFEEMPTANEIKTPTKANGSWRDASSNNGEIPELNNSSGEKIEKVEKGKSHSPVKISPFQIRFTKRKGSYDLEKRASLEGIVESPKKISGDCE